MRYITSVSLVLAALLGPATPTALTAPVRYHLTDIGEMPPFIGLPYGKVNDLGQAIVTYKHNFIDGSGVWKWNTLIWDPSGQLNSLADQINPAWTDRGLHDINNRGQAIGFAYEPPLETGLLPASRKGGSYLYDLAHGATPIARSKYVSSINDAGWLIVDNHVLWHTAKTSYSLDVLASPRHAITDINNNGQVLGTYLVDSTPHGFIYDTVSATLHDLGQIGPTPAPSIYDNSYWRLNKPFNSATVLTDTGHALVFDAHRQQYFVWSPQHGRQYVPDNIRDLNSHNQLIGTRFDSRVAFNDSYPYRPYLQQVGSVADFLEDLLVSGEGWTLKDAFDINDSGQILGRGLYEEKTHLYLLTPFTIQAGDATTDGQFSSDDLIAVMSAAKYETDQVAGWAEGDWNEDERFNTLDLIAAFAIGHYEQGPYYPAASSSQRNTAGRSPVATVPEPAAWFLALSAVGTLHLIRMNRRSLRQ